MTLAEWLAEGMARLLAGAHPDRARRDAEALLRHALQRERSSLLAHLNEVPEPEQADRYLDLIERRRTGEPIQYITGEVEFYGLPFNVTRDVLIPRPETEHLVEKVIEVAANFHAPRIVDIGAGSGAIAIALAHHLPHAHITATDIWARALDVAHRNADRNGVSGHIRFLNGDLFAPVAMEQFEIVVSNPPYVSINDRESLAVEVRDHEPGLALFAGLDGLEVFRRLIPAAFAALIHGGFLAIEIGFGQSKEIEALLANAGYEGIEFALDLQSIPRLAVAQRP